MQSEVGPPCGWREVAGETRLLIPLLPPCPQYSMYMGDRLQFCITVSREPLPNRLHCVALIPTPKRLERHTRGTSACLSLNGPPMPPTPPCPWARRDIEEHSHTCIPHTLIEADGGARPRGDTYSPCLHFAVLLSSPRASSPSRSALPPCVCPPHSAAAHLWGKSARPRGCRRCCGKKRRRRYSAIADDFVPTPTPTRSAGGVARQEREGRERGGPREGWAEGGGGGVAHG